MINDISLLQRYARTRDAEAFGELTRRYAGLVYGTCLRVTRNHADAEDVAQECFIELAMKAGTITTSLPGWLHTLAQRRAIDRVRRDTTRRRYEEEALRDVSSTVEPSWEEIAPLVDAALTALPEEVRTPVLLHYLGGNTQQEIARAMSIHQSTVSRRIEQGVAQLRDHLREAGVVVSLTLLTAVLTEHAAVAAPASPLASLGNCAMTGAAATTTTSTLFGTLLGKAAVGLLAATFVTIGVIFSGLLQPRQMTARPPITMAAAAFKLPAQPVTDSHLSRVATRLTSVQTARNAVAAPGHAGWRPLAHRVAAAPRAAFTTQTPPAQPAYRQPQKKDVMPDSGPVLIAQAPAVKEETAMHSTEDAHATEPKQDKSKTIVAKEPTGRWPGWALHTEQTPGWANTPPRPGEAVVFDAPPGTARTFSGHVVGIDKFAGVEVGLISLKDIYWVRNDTYLWQPVNADGTFQLTDTNYPEQNKCVAVRAPGRPWSFCSYIFKAPQSGRDIVLQCDKGRQIMLTARTDNAKEPADFTVQVFVLHQSWVHDNNPLGYQFAGRVWSQDGKLLLPLPAEPVGLYLSAKGAACDWEIIDPREADRFDVTLLREGLMEGTVLREGKPVPGTTVSIINMAAAFSLRMPGTDEQGRFGGAGLPPGQYSVSCGNASQPIEVREGETTQVTLNLTQ